MKLLLSHGYFIGEDPKEQLIMRPYPPLGLLSISAFLKQKGIPNTIFDTTFSSMAAFQAYLLEHKPRYLALYVNLMTKLNILKMIRFVREREELKGMRIILGGPEVTHHIEPFLQHGADFIVLGEGEETLYDLVSTLDTPWNPFMDRIQGIAFRNMNGEVVQTPAREKIKDLDHLPVPNREGIELQKYLDTWKKHHGYSMISVSTMRGCPYTCKWCSRAVYGLSYRRRSPALVARELAQLKSKYNPDAIWFVDDVFTVSHKWLREFADEVRRQDAVIPYECITRADRMNEEVVDLLVRTGCFRVWIGAESGSQKVLDLMDRRVQASQVREMIQLAQAKGLEAGTFIMLGYPGEEWEDIVATRDHLVAAIPDLFTITVAYPIKGTELYTEVENHLIKPLPWESSTDRDKDFVRPYSHKFYQNAIRWIVNDVNYHKARKAGVEGWGEGVKFKLKALAARAGLGK
ncbi:MAG: B12-binding domain-containing radical SAM protein [Bacteroidia bacterium]|nr:B12-binding domain-containing radical SAM protein [Bacteroidia bacterium]